jgi:hypothetical protein
MEATVSKGRVGMRKERFSCERDGLVLRGDVYGRCDGARPAVILCHGFLATRGMCDGYARLLAELGYVCFAFDFSGGGIGSKSDGKSVDMTVFTEVADLEAVRSYVGGLPYVDEDDVTVLGCSQGGLVTMLFAKRHPELAKRLILLYPALGIPDDARKGSMMFYRFDPENIPDVLGTLPMKLGGDYARTVAGLDVFDEIGGFDRPVLYLHGTADEVVDIAYARRAHELYPDCLYVEVEGGGHMFRGRAEKEARAAISAFMERGVSR